MNIEHDYLENLIEINKNLRNQLELLYNLLRTKLKIENFNDNSKLDNILNELEILKTSLSFNMQKQSNIVKNIKHLENTLHNQENLKSFIEDRENKIKHLEHLVDQYSKENMLMQERYQKVDINTHDIRIDLENKISELDFIKKENIGLKIIIDDEKTKNKNLVALIKELEKKKSNVKMETECLNLREQVDFLNGRNKELEGKFKNKLEKKDLIIKKLDESLLDYEDKLNCYRK